MMRNLNFHVSIFPSVILFYYPVSEPYTNSHIINVIITKNISVP